MSTTARHAFAAIAAAALFATPCDAQQRTGLMGDLIKDVTELQGKLTSLAKEIPTDKYGWRPAADTRSVGEVLLHVAADNYFIPAGLGVKADPSTRITDYPSTIAYEKQKLTRDEILAQVDKSFAHLVKVMNETPDAKLDEMVPFFGQQMSRRMVWILTVTHLHEHLGQAIAYARSNNIVPPWSRRPA